MNIDKTCNMEICDCVSICRHTRQRSDSTECLLPHYTSIHELLYKLGDIKVKPPVHHGVLLNMKIHAQQEARRNLEDKSISKIIHWWKNVKG